MELNDLIVTGRTQQLSPEAYAFLLRSNEIPIQTTCLSKPNLDSVFYKYDKTVKETKNFRMDGFGFKSFRGESYKDFKIPDEEDKIRIYESGVSSAIEGGLERRIVFLVSNKSIALVHYRRIQQNQNPVLLEKADGKSLSSKETSGIKLMQQTDVPGEEEFGNLVTTLDESNPLASAVMETWTAESTDLKGALYYGESSKATSSNVFDHYEFESGLADEILVNKAVVVDEERVDAEEVSVYRVWMHLPKGGFLTGNCDVLVCGGFREEEMNIDGWKCIFDGEEVAVMGFPKGAGFTFKTPPRMELGKVEFWLVDAGGKRMTENMSFKLES